MPPNYLVLMKGTVVNFRRGMHRTVGNQLVIKVEGIEKKEKALSLVGKMVTWTAPGKNKTTITGKIAAPHGNAGTVRAIFERGLPGQALGTEIKVE